MRRQILSLLLALALLLSLTGCANWTERAAALLPGGEEPAHSDGEAAALPYAELEYSRPNPAALRKTANAVCAALEAGAGDAELLRLLDLFYERYWSYYGMYSIAMIESDADINNDAMWEEYQYCCSIAPEVDEIIGDLLRACARSDRRQALEDAYFGPDGLAEFITDGTTSAELQALYARELELMDQYRRLHGQMSQHTGSDTAFYHQYAGPAAQLYLELIAVRNAQAAYCGYDSYAQMVLADADIDYTREDRLGYYDAVRQYFVPVYRQQIEAGAYDAIRLPAMAPEEAFQVTCDALMRQDVAGISECLSALGEGGYYNVAASTAKRDTTYSIYIDSVDMPFLFLYPSGDASDCLSIAHELGHCADMYVNYDTTVSTDISETLSQGMEYLLLCQKGMDAQLLRYKLLECLESKLYTASLSLFEFQAYELAPEELTEEKLHQLFAQISADYGMYDTPQTADAGWIYVDHLFEMPFYVFSYEPADTAAFSVLMMEQAKAHSGEEAYRKLQRNAPDFSFQAALEEAGIPTPFSADSVSRQAQTICQMLERSAGEAYFPAA